MHRPAKTSRKKTRRTRAAARLTPAFDSWREISRRVRAAKNIALFLDFDGTLVDFRPRPHLVKLRARTRAALWRLAVHRAVRVTVVSGRRRASLLQFIKVPRVRLAGLYGWEGAGGLRVSDATARKLRQARPLLGALLNDSPDIFIEDKAISFAVHFRGASAASERRAHIRLRKLLARFRPNLRIIRAGNVWEVTARQVEGKGPAVRRMLRQFRHPLLAIYVGDDLTDEPAFKSLRKGITVLVGPRRPTSAHFSLRTPAEVCVFLERLGDVLR